MMINKGNIMSYTVDAVSKAIELLFRVEKKAERGITALAKRSGNTKARAFRLLTPLEESGLVRRRLPWRPTAWVIAH